MGDLGGLIDFRIPAISENLRDLELEFAANEHEFEGEDGSRNESCSLLRVSKAYQLDGVSSDDQLAFVEGLVSQLKDAANVCDLICFDGNWFDGLYSTVRFFSDLSCKAKRMVLDQLLFPLLFRIVSTISQFDRTGDNQMLPIITRTGYKVTVYLLAKICVEEEKRWASRNYSSLKQPKASSGQSDDDDDDTDKRKPKSSESYCWIAYRSKALTALIQSILPMWHADDSLDNEKHDIIDFRSLWKLGVPEEAFLDLFWRTAESLVIDNPKLANSSSSATSAVECALVIELVCAPLHHFHANISHVIAASFAHALSKHESMPVFVVQVLARLFRHYQDDRFPKAMILELGRVDTSELTKDTSSLKQLGSFIENLCKWLPALGLSNLSVLLPHLGAQAYALRSSVTRALGLLSLHLRSVEASKTGDNVETEKNTKDSEQNDVENLAKVNTKETQDQLLMFICERCHDSSSFVRGAAISTLCELAKAGALPLSSVNISSEAVCERLFDVSSIVRKQAISALTAYLENNPYRDQLDTDLFKNKLSQLEAQVRSKEVNSGNSSDSEDIDKADIDSSESKANNQDDEDDESVRTLAALHYFRDAFEFSSRMETACIRAEELLTSKSVTDVIESLRFLSTAMRFKVSEARNSMRRMMSLVWDTRDSDKIKRELLETFELIYISQPVSVGRLSKRVLYSKEEITDSLINLVLSSTLSDLTSLEAIVSELVNPDGTLKRVSLPLAVLENLWHIASGTHSKEFVLQKRRAAMNIIAMAASCAPLKGKIAPVTLLGEVVRQTKDFQFARHAFIATRRLLSRYFLTDSLSVPEELESLVDQTVASLVLSTDGWAVNDNPRRWYPAAEEGIRLLMLCCPRPDHTLASLVRNFHKQIFNPLKNSKCLENLNEHQLSQFFFLIGHVAVQLYVYAEKKCNDLNRKRKGEQDAVNRKQSAGEQEELSMLGGDEDAQDDYEERLLKRISEEELVGSSSLLGCYLPLVIRIAMTALESHKEKQERDDAGDNDSLVDDTLLESATLAICKMMCISQRLCEEHLRLLFTLLRDIRNPNVRGNIMVAMGSFAVRFPNVVEPFTSQIYRTLRDKDHSVRKTSLMVLSFLILNDMIKIRGEITELAICIADENVRIRDLARLFFNELGSKGNNTLYNILPDTICAVSRDPSVDEEMFRDISDFIMKLVVLDKHVVGIADKFSQRIFLATGLLHGEEEIDVIGDLKNIQLCRDITFSISRLKPSEATVKKLNSDSVFKLYKPVLVDETVHKNLQTYMKRVRQSVSNDCKAIVDEWTTRVEKIRAKQLDNNSSTVRAMGATRKKTSNGAKLLRPSKKVGSLAKPAKIVEKSIRSRKLKYDSTESSSSDEYEEESYIETKPTTKKSTIRTRSRLSKENFAN